MVIVIKTMWVYMFLRSLKIKIFGSFILVMSLVFVLLGFFVYSVSGKLFLDEFKQSKFNIAKHLAAQIDGQKHHKIAAEQDSDIPEYRQYQKLLSSILSSEKNLTYVYSVSLINNELFYAVDGMTMEYDTVWIECDDFALSIFVKKSIPTINYQETESVEKIFLKYKKSTLPAEFRGESLFIGKAEILKILNKNPLTIRIGDVIIDRTNYKDSVEKKYFLEGDEKTITISYTPVGQAGSTAGSPYVDDKKTIEKMKKIILSNKDFIEENPTETSYGEILSAYAVIRNSNGTPEGLIGVDATLKDINRFQNQIRTIVLIAFSGAFFLFLMLSRLISSYLTRPLEKFSSAIKSMSAGNYNLSVNIRSKDEFGELADSFNTMAENVKKAHEELRELSTSYSRFVPQEFIQQLQKESIVDVRLGDQIQKKMTVLFSDIRNFTTLSESMKPEENFNFINSYLKRFGPIIRQHHGFIDKYIGDNIMALFSDENILEAVDSAIDMREELKVYNYHRSLSGYVPIETGIGIHSGNLMLGTIGEAERMDGTVISDVVNTASRLEGLTKTFGVPVIISSEIYEVIKDLPKYHTRFLGIVKVKGKNESMYIYELLNGLPDDILEKRLETKKVFEHAIELYLERYYEEAWESFFQVLQKGTDDNAAAFYSSKIFQVRHRVEVSDINSEEE